MSRIRVPYAIEDGKLSTRQLRWPQYCVCCGAAAPDSSLRVQHAARYSSTRDVNPTYTTTTTSGYYLNWDVPCCPSCLRHHKRSQNPVNWITLAVPAIAVDFAVGFGLFSMGLSENVIANASFAAFVGLSMLAAIFGARWIGRTRLAQATRMMGPRCTCAGPVVTPSSDLENIYFEIPNAPFAESFASINGLA